MPEGLDKLKVSLTKNGYFKVAEVIKRHPRAEILDNISGQHDGIKLNDAQIKNMLSFDDDSQEFPDVWDEVRNYDEKSVEALVLISIIYSHKDLIKALSASMISEMRGILKRSSFGNNEKVYTNLVYSMASIGMCPVIQGAEEATYETYPLLRLDIGPLAKKVIGYKLDKVGWTPPGSDDYFKRDFYEQCQFFEFHKVLGISIDQFKQWMEGDEVKREHPPSIETEDKQIQFSASLVSALSSKPFTILAGTTGTGKTKTIRDLAHQLNPVETDPQFNHAFIPVEAGWTDGRHLVGYKNPFGQIGETYVTTPLIDVLLRANYPDYSEVPFFIILDEMNLSHVEMYFSKFLSIMETAQDTHSEPILGVDDLQLLYKSSLTDPIQAEYVLKAIHNGGLYITNNVFFVGTVNMDETTYMFSPKVLDRSFVLRFAPPLPSDVSDSFSIPSDDLGQGASDELSSFLISDSNLVADRQYDNYLDSLYGALDRFRFGPRTTNEARCYVGKCGDMKGKFTLPDDYLDRKSVLDRLTLQKVLPKVHGNRDILLPILKKLIGVCDLEDLGESKEKLEQLKEEVKSTGFANYFSSI